MTSGKKTKAKTRVKGDMKRLEAMMRDSQSHLERAAEHARKATQRAEKAQKEADKARSHFKEIEKLTPNPTLMIEHLSEAQLKQGLEFIFAKAEALGITFENSGERDPSILDGSNTEYFAPHLD